MSARGFVLAIPYTPGLTPIFPPVMGCFGWYKPSLPPPGKDKCVTSTSLEKVSPVLPDCADFKALNPRNPRLIRLLPGQAFDQFDVVSEAVDNHRRF